MLDVSLKYLKIGKLVGCEPATYITKVFFTDCSIKSAELPDDVLLSPTRCQRYRATNQSSRAIDTHEQYDTAVSECLCEFGKFKKNGKITIFIDRKKYCSCIA